LVGGIGAAICILGSLFVTVSIVYFSIMVFAFVYSSCFYTLILMHCGKVYGPDLGPKAYTIISFALIIAVVSCTIIGSLVSMIGWVTALWIIAGLSGVSILCGGYVSEQAYIPAGKKMTEKLL
jgi:hypothetical protein